MMVAHLFAFVAPGALMFISMIVGCVFVDICTLISKRPPLLRPYLLLVPPQIIAPHLHLHPIF